MWCKRFAFCLRANPKCTCFNLSTVLTCRLSFFVFRDRLVMLLSLTKKLRLAGFRAPSEDEITNSSSQCRAFFDLAGGNMRLQSWLLNTMAGSLTPNDSQGWDPGNLSSNRVRVGREFRGNRKGFCGRGNFYAASQQQLCLMNLMPVTWRKLD